VVCSRVQQSQLEVADYCEGDKEALSLNSIAHGSLSLKLSDLVSLGHAEL